jgi:roadblock/LC7 domain-containing protein
MSLYSELADIPGVIAAGEYAYRGDRYSYKGHLDDEQARMASIMCRATTMATHMQTDILCANSENCPFDNARGWVVKGPQFSVCVVANVFCFLQNEQGLLNKVLQKMRDRLADVQELI